MLIFALNLQMAFSKIADTYFAWNFDYFQNSTVDSLEEKTYHSPEFITSVYPYSEWNLVLSVRKHQDKIVLPNRGYYDHYDYQRDNRTRIIKKLIDIELICNEKVPIPKDIKVNITIGVGIEAVTKSCIFGNEKKISFYNFIDCETMLKKDYMQIIVQMFLRTKTNQSFTDFTNSEFLSDLQIFIKEKKFYVHKVNHLFCLQI